VQRTFFNFLNKHQLALLRAARLVVASRTTGHERLQSQPNALKMRAHERPENGRLASTRKNAKVFASRFS